MWGWWESVCPPGMEDGEKADVGAQPARIGGEFRHGARRRRKQDGVDRGLVLKSDGGDGRRHGENDVEIGNVEKLGAACGKPFLARGALAFGAMTIPASNGRRPLLALWANPVMGSWRPDISIFL